MDNSQQRKIPSKVCEICHGNEGFLQPKPCKCGEKLKVIHQKCLIENGRHFLNQHKDTMKDTTFALRCEICNQFIGFKWEKKYMTWSQIINLIHQQKFLLLLFVPVYIFLLYIFVFAGYNLIHICLSGIMKYWELSPFIIMIILSSIILTAMTIRSFVAITQWKIHLVERSELERLQKNKIDLQSYP